MDLAGSGERSSGRGMTVQAQSLGLDPMGMTVTIKVGAMTSLAVFAADCAYRTALKRSVGSRVMAGRTAQRVMSLASSDIRGGTGIMTVHTQSNGRHRMSMTVTIKIGAMTSLAVSTVDTVQAAADR